MSEGPFVGAAFFCERVIEDKEGVLTAVRIVDRFIQTVIGQGTPPDMPPVQIPLTLLVTLKSGDATGRHEVQLDVEEPSGLKRRVAAGLSVLFEGQERGVNLILPIVWMAQQEGLYWFDVLLEGRRLTRVPLRVLYLRQETGPAPAAGAGS